MQQQQRHQHAFALPCICGDAGPLHSSRTGAIRSAVCAITSPAPSRSSRAAVAAIRASRASTFGSVFVPARRSWAAAAPHGTARVLQPTRASSSSDAEPPRDEGADPNAQPFVHPELAEGEPEMLGLDFLNKQKSLGDDVFDLSLWAMSSRVVYPIAEDRVQLHIFEERFRMMYNEVLEEEPYMYGCVWFDPTNGLVASVGVSCEITEYQRLPDGRIIFDSEPRRRFQVVDVIQQAPFLKCKVREIADQPPKSEAEEEAIAKLEKNAVQILTDLLRLSDKISGQGSSLPDHIRKWLPDAPEAAAISDFERTSTLSLVLCSVLELAPKDRQFLLQTRELPLRLRIVGEVLDRARKILAAKASLKDAFN